MDRRQLIMTAYFGTMAVILLFDILAAGRIIHLRAAPRRFAAITAFAALLLAPAILVEVSASSILYGRAIQPITWLWPFVTILFVLQAMYALSRRLVRSMYGMPVLAYNFIIAIIAIAHYASYRGFTPPGWMLVLSAACASALSPAGGTAALWKVSYMLIPLFSPSLPSRWRLGTAVRGILAFTAFAIMSLVAVEIPNAIAAIKSYAPYDNAKLQERPDHDFNVGLKILPDLRTLPSPVAIKNDLALADSLGIRVISIVINPEAARGLALDSLAKVIDMSRTDSTRLIVTLGYPRKALLSFNRSPKQYTDRRLVDVNRIARKLRPNILIPALEPYGEGRRLLGLQSSYYWKQYFTSAAKIAHGVNPNIKVGFEVSSFGSRDSTLYTWAASNSSPIDVIGFSLMPGFDGAMSIETNTRVAQRWMTAASSSKPHWVWSAGGYPLAHGERNQARALWGVLAWATQQSNIRGVVVTEAGDYDALRGLRAPSGRLRPAVGSVIKAVKGLKE